MPPPLDTSRYIAVWERALQAEKGIKVSFTSQGHATQFRQWMHAARSKERKRSVAIFPPEHPQYGKSSYDTLYITMPEGEAGGKFSVQILPSNEDSPLGFNIEEN